MEYYLLPEITFKQGHWQFDSRQKSKNPTRLSTPIGMIGMVKRQSGGKNKIT